MIPRFQFFLLLALVFASVVLGERRGISPTTTAPRSFSAPEQALFGTCTSEDCVLGPAQGSSYFQSPSVEEIVPVSSSTHPVVDGNHHEQPDDTMASHDVDSAKEGRFGRPPSFIRQK